MTSRVKNGFPLIAIFIGLASSFVFYYPILLEPLVYDFRDMSRVLLPFEHMVRGLLSVDALPLWNSMGGLGKPLFADPLSGLTYPLQYFFRLFPEPFGWNLSIAVHHALAFVGAFLFLSTLKIDRAGASVGALCFSFGGYLVSTDNMLNALQSVTWFPWVFWAFFALLEGRQVQKAIALTSLFIAFSFLGGMPEVVGYEIAILGFLALFPTCVQSPLPLFSRFGALLVIFVFSFALSAISFLPLYDFLSLSTRSIGLDASAITELSFDPLRILEFFYPWKFLDKGNHVPWALTVVIGPVLIFVLPALRYARLRSTLFAVIVGLLFLSAAMGSYLPGYDEIIEQYQILRVARHPEKFLLVPYALLCLAIAFGYHQFLRRRMSAPGHVAMVLIVFSTLWVLNHDVYSLVSWNTLTQEPLTIKPFRDIKKPVRIYADGIGPSADPDLVDFPGVQKALFLHHFGLFYEVNNINAPSSLNLEGGEKVVKFIEQAGPERLIDHLSLFSVSHVTSTQTLEKVEGLQPLGYASKVNVFAVPRSRPRIYIPKNIYVTSRKEEMEYMLPQVAKYEGDAVILSSELEPGWNEIKGELLESRVDGDSIRFRVSFEANGIVVVNDAYHPDWKASCERPCDAKVLLANGYVRAISLPPGEHRVLLEYRPSSVFLGMGISFLSLLILVYLLVSARDR